MRFLSFVILIFFINFTALPSIAVMLDWELPTLSSNITEEEVKNDFASINEKLPPQSFNFYDFFTVFQTVKPYYIFVHKDDSIHLSPYISIFSPPPEV